MSADGRFTAEQQAAIERRRGSFALAANAGSGKTSVLVERYVRAVLRDGVAPARILAITFTDRAAGELRERVRAALVARASCEPTPCLPAAPPISACSGTPRRRRCATPPSKTRSRRGSRSRECSISPPRSR